MTAAKLSLIKSSCRRLGAWVATAMFVLMTCSVFAQASPPPKEQKKGSPKPGAVAERRAKAQKAAEERRKRRRPPQADKNKKEGEKPAAGKKEKKDEQDADPKAENGEEVPEAVEIDGNLRRRIDALLKTEEEVSTQPLAGSTPTLSGGRRGPGRAKTPVPQSAPGGKPKPGNRSRSRPDRRSKTTSGDALSGPEIPLNIPAAIESTPPEDRTYFFSIVDGTYAQLIEGIARETGLGVIGAAPKDGKVSF
ncbi:MAG: hypothetical protein IIC02_11600, partial [Planctomycetes bacterium]|nr:hypothetical protein [Planctomycetota bacterium]